MVVSVIVFAIGAVVSRDPRWLLCAAIFGGLALLLTIIHTFEANSARCAVCSASLFSRVRCTKHKNAQRLLGSVRLHAATSIILFCRYRCHHCGELVVLDDGTLDEDEPAAEGNVFGESLAAPAPWAARSNPAAVPPAGSGAPVAPQPRIPTATAPQPGTLPAAVIPPAAHAPAAAPA
ncbi:MAG: hypothetical protein HKN82_17805, partial [Akkermansiaceae bacterium]|nr:hypothetical protein [Akkermansiaceae bacterium]